MNKYVIPIIIPYVGEKRDWIFDNQQINKNNNELTIDVIEEIIKKHLKKIEEADEQYYVELAFLGTDFTNLSEEKQEELLEFVQKYIRMARIDGMRDSIRPKNTTKQKLKMLKKYKVKTIELEVYSTNEYILKKIGMEYNFKNIKKASRMIRFYRFNLGHKITIGLPESTKIDDINTAKSLIKLKTKMVSINPVLVIKDTPLEKEFEDLTYKPLTVVQALETCKELAKIFNEKNIEIIAIGFEPLDSDVKQEVFSEKVIAGPFHPAFREQVESGLWYDAIVNKIKKLNTKVMEVEVTVNPEDTNNVIGYKQENINKLKEVYDVDLIVTSDKNMKNGKSKIEITKEFNWGDEK